MLVPIANRFLHWSVIGMISPVLVLMIMSKGIEIEAIGFVMASMSASVVILEVPSGILSDLIGRKKVYLLSLALAMLALSIIYLSRGAVGICLGFILYGASRAFSSGSIESAYIDEHIARRGKEALHSLISAMSVAEAAGLALGALFGGYAPTLWSRAFPSENRYNGNIVAQICIILGLFVLTACTRCRESGERRQGIVRFLGESKKFLRETEVVRLLLIGVVFWGMLLNALEVFWQPRLQEVIGEPGRTWVFGVVNSGYFLASILGNLFIGALLSRLKLPPWPLIGCMRVIVGLAVIALSAQASIGGFSLVFLAIMCFGGMMSVPEGTTLNALIPNEKRASFLSLASLMMQVGGIAGSLAFGSLKRIATIGELWIIAGTVFLGSSVIYLKASKAAAKQ